MDKTEYKIIEVLTQSLGEDISINELSRRISPKKIYKNIYTKVKSLEQTGQLILKASGKSLIPQLDFGNPALLSKLVAFEFEKKNRFLLEQPSLAELLSEISGRAREFYASAFTILGNPNRCRTINSWDILIVLKGALPRGTAITQFQELEKKHNTRINALIVSSVEFRKYLSGEEENPVKAFLRGRILLGGAESFWRSLQAMNEKGLKFRIWKDTRRVTESDIRSNLPRFGYSAVSPADSGSITLEGGKKLCIERLIALILISKPNARLIEAIPILVAKNAVNHELLFFLAKKHGIINKVGFLLDITERLLKDEMKKQGLLEIIPEYKKLKSEIEEKLTPGAKRGDWSRAREWGIVTNWSMKDFKERMRLYNAI